MSLQQVPQIMAFIAERQTEQRCDCYVFYSSLYANEIARTLNESFDLAHQRYLNQRVDPTKDQQIAHLTVSIMSTKPYLLSMTFCRSVSKHSKKRMPCCDSGAQSSLRA